MGQEGDYEDDHGERRSNLRVNQTEDDDEDDDDNPMARKLRKMKQQLRNQI